MRLLQQPGLQRALGLLIGAVFVYASLDKIAHPADFARIVYHYQVVGPNRLLPPALPNAFALALPWVELLTGILLIAGIWRREAAAVAALLLLAFLGAVGSARYRGIDIESCGCFTVTAAGRHAGALLLLEDAALLAAALVLFVRPQQGAPAAAAELTTPAR